MDGLIRRPDGIVLVTGPTGSGKTTTLYACINRINKPNLNILTAEDPVEYEIQGIHQVHVQPKIGPTFARHALRAFLRQDPDIVMVGEIRDHETLEIAINASLTGHLVLSTIHTNDAAGAITRTIDLGAEPFLLRSSVIGILAQRLVRVICQHCKYPYPAEDFELEELEPHRPSEVTPRWSSPRRDNPATRYLPAHVLRDPDLWPLETFDPAQRPTIYKAKGCDQCTNTVFSGRRGIYELMLIDDAIGPLILRKADARAIKRAAWEQGMDTLRDDGARKVLAGRTTVEEVLAATQEDMDADPVVQQSGPGRRGSVGHGRLRIPRRLGRQRQERAGSSRRGQRQDLARAAQARRGAAHQRAGEPRARRRPSLARRRVALPARQPERRLDDDPSARDAGHRRHPARRGRGGGLSSSRSRVSSSSAFSPRSSIA